MPSQKDKAHIGTFKRQSAGGQQLNTESKYIVCGCDICDRIDVMVIFICDVKLH